MDPFNAWHALDSKQNERSREDTKAERNDRFCLWRRKAGSITGIERSRLQDSTRSDLTWLERRRRPDDHRQGTEHINDHERYKQATSKWIFQYILCSDFPHGPTRHVDTWA